MSDAFVHLRASGSSEASPADSPTESKDEDKSASTQQQPEQAANDRGSAGSPEAADREAALAHAARTFPKIPPRISKEHVKILIVGERGVGKTTLWRNLLASYAGAHAPRAATSLVNFREAPESLATQVSVALSDTATLVYTIQEAPGYGDDLDVSANIAAVVDFLDACFAAQADAQSSPLPNHSLSHLVDICLYLLPPRRLAVSDAAFLRRLASHVAVLPVLARADALPVEEATAIRDSAAEQLYRQPPAEWKAAGPAEAKSGTPPGSGGAVGDGSRDGQSTGDSAEDTATSRPAGAAAAAAADAQQSATANPAVTDSAGSTAAGAPFRFSDAALAAAGVPNSAFLPAIVAGDTLSAEHEVPWPLRRRRFGSPLEALNPEHSDLLLLKRLVLEEGHHELRAAKAQRFAVWGSARRTATALSAAPASAPAFAEAAAPAAAPATAAASSGTEAAPPVSKPSMFYTPSKWTPSTISSPPASESTPGMDGPALGSRLAPYKVTYDIESHSPFDARIHHIAAMNEFSDWSPEQLRWQDYQAGVGLKPPKLPAAFAASSSFSSTSQPAANSAAIPNPQELLWRNTCQADSGFATFGSGQALWPQPAASPSAVPATAGLPVSTAPAAAVSAVSPLFGAQQHPQQQHPGLQVPAAGGAAASATLAARLSSLSLGVSPGSAGAAAAAPAQQGGTAAASPAVAPAAAVAPPAMAFAAAGGHPAFSLSLADSVSPPDSSRSTGSAIGRPGSTNSAATTTPSPLNPAAPSFVFGGTIGGGVPMEAVHVATGGAPAGQTAAFHGQLFGGGGGVRLGTPVQLLNPADGSPVVFSTQPFLQAAAAKPYHFGAAPQLGQFVFGGVPTLASLFPFQQPGSSPTVAQQPAFGQSVLVGQTSAFSQPAAGTGTPASQPPVAQARGPAFAGAGGITFSSLAAAAAVASQPAGVAHAAAASAPATLAAAGAAVVSVGPSPLGGAQKPLPFGMPAGPFPLPSPTFGFGGGSSSAVTSSGVFSAGTAAVAMSAAPVAAISAAGPSHPPTTPAGAAPAASAAAAAARSGAPPAATAAASAAPTRPPIPRVPIAAAVSAAAAASPLPVAAADTPRGGIETPRASAAKKPKSETRPQSDTTSPPPDATSSASEAPSTAFSAGGGSKESAPLQAPPTSLPPAFGTVGGNGAGTQPPVLKSPPAATASAPPLMFGSGGSSGVHATRARTPSGGGAGSSGHHHHHHHSHSISRAASAGAPATSTPASADSPAASQPPRRTEGPAASPAAASAPFVNFGANGSSSSGGGGSGNAAGNGTRPSPQGGHGRGRGGGRGHSRSR